MNNRLLISSIDYSLFYAIFLLYSCGFLLNEIFKHYSLPPVFTVLRIFLIIVLFFRIISLKMAVNQNTRFLILLVCCLSIYYLTICVPNGDFLIGLKSLRIYVEPLMFALMVYIYRHNDMPMKYLQQIYIKSVLITALISIVFYIIYWTGHINYFISEVPLTSFLSGGIIFRSYLPIGCPNQLGLFLLSGIVLAYLSEIKKKKCVLIFLTISLILTISKSAILAALFYFGLLYCGKFRNIRKLIVFWVLLFFCYFIIELYFPDTPFYIYITNLFSGNDPSSNGHIASLQDAIEAFPEYYLFGYPTGTVGARVETIYNVESSFFILMYDKGILFFLIYMFIMFMLFADSLKVKPIRIYIYAIMLALSVLPTIQSLECFALILVSPLLLSRIKIVSCNI